MRKEKGVTLIALIIYILISLVAVGLLTELTGYINRNLGEMTEDLSSSSEFDRFNSEFVSDIKKATNDNATITSNSGNIEIRLGNAVYTYVLTEGAIYKNSVKISKDIAVFSATKEQDTTTSKWYIKVQIGEGPSSDNIIFGKTIKYVLKYW